MPIYTIKAGCNAGIHLWTMLVLKQLLNFLLLRLVERLLEGLDGLQSEQPDTKFNNYNVFGIENAPSKPIINLSVGLFSVMVLDSKTQSTISFWGGKENVTKGVFRFRCENHKTNWASLHSDQQ